MMTKKVVDISGHNRVRPPSHNPGTPRMRDGLWQNPDANETKGYYQASDCTL